jgi:toxin ParE1/3/4
VNQYSVFLTGAASDDLHDLYNFLWEHEVEGRADKILNKLEELIQSLSVHPDRGSLPKELVAIGIREYRELHFKPYRILYRVIDKKVFVYLIADGRRDFQTLLQRRLMGA